MTSAPAVADLPPTTAEVAVVGRSNVGKSSLLNALADVPGLAKVSSKPGRTRLLNVFSHPGGATIVDLPGVGFAHVSKQDRAAWQRRMDDYLLQRAELQLVLVLVDGEIGPARRDIELLAWLREHALPFQVVATKHDKIKPSRRERRKRDLAAGCDLGPGEVIWTSVERGLGLDRLRGVVRAALGA